MNCAESSRLVHAYVDGELDVPGNLQLERHFETCPECAVERKSVLSLKSALRGAGLRFEAPESLRREVGRMARSARGQTPRGWFSPVLLWKSWALGATAFALALMMFRPGSNVQDQLATEAIGSHVRSLMAEHLTDVATSDQHTVKPWFNGKLDFAPEVHDFAAQGFPLIGGRLDYLNNREVAALVYRRNKHFVNVFVWPSAAGGNGQLAMKERRGYSLIDLEARGLHYCLVSDLNTAELAQLAKLIEH